MVKAARTCRWRRRRRGDTGGRDGARVEVERLRVRDGSRRPGREGEKEMADDRGEGQKAGKLKEACEAGEAV